MVQSDTEKMSDVAQFLKDLGLSGKSSPGNEDGHYFGRIEPLDFIEDQELGYHEGSIIKYVSRWKYKGGVQDLMKAGWFLLRLIQLEQRRLAEEASKGERK